MYPTTFVCLIIAAGIASVRGDCWNTGCQLNTWAVTGCAQYGRVETARSPCNGGYIFTCCTGGGQTSTSAPAPAPSPAPAPGPSGDWSELKLQFILKPRHFVAQMDLFGQKPGTSHITTLGWLLAAKRSRTMVNIHALVIFVCRLSVLSAIFVCPLARIRFFLSVLTANIHALVFCYPHANELAPPTPRQTSPWKCT